MSMCVVIVVALWFSVRIFRRLEGPRWTTELHMLGSECLEFKAAPPQTPSRSEGFRVGKPSFSLIHSALSYFHSEIGSESSHKLHPDLDHPYTQQLRANIAKTTKSAFATSFSPFTGRHYQPSHDLLRS